MRARRRSTRLLREATHQLGRLEAEAERRWKKLSHQARHDAARLLHRLEVAIEPPRPKPRKRVAGKTGRRKTPGAAVEAAGTSI